MIKHKNITLFLLSKEHKEIYYNTGFKFPDSEVDYFTGTSGSFSYEDISNFIDKTVSLKNRRHFLIYDEDALVGEIVLSNIDQTLKSCDFRIAIFNKINFNKKYGTNAMEAAFKYAFNELDIESIYLEVYDFNHRGIHVYKSFGFQETERALNDEGMVAITMVLNRD
jgi:RimJ/RimL family protein N-acetyltransferase